MKNKIIYMPHPGHFICSSHCRFFLNTYVNGYIVSTIGEYVPDSAVRNISRQCENLPTDLKGDAEEFEFIKRHTVNKKNKTGYGEDIGYGRKYETMVFKAVKSKRGCCEYMANFQKDFDFEGYNFSEDAYKGHMKYVKKYSK